MEKEKRSEEEKIAQAPIEVILGGRKHQIKPLVIRDSREWRKKVIALLAQLPGMLNITTDSPEDFGGALSTLLVTMPDQVIDLFFEYAKDLSKEEIEGIATDDEIAKAFEKVVEVAFPLAESLPKVMKHISR